ncbi:uncharacterized protein LOC119380160 [Rhipicephalus sanguineus]|uniref:uncharacterized protein LOC119380160 n=1 Tax=Rhipicephalus sanguineus TaxID=34632 RepID=UPI0018935FA2|nr:uncharacterized protein LOC119380160 [Rhipicephalus sanguineus]
MPTCAELAKRIDELESRLLSESDRMTDRIVDKIAVKMKSSGVDVLELKKHVDSLESSLKFLNDLVDKLNSEKASLVAENKALKDENCSLSRKVSQLEQYSRMNNVEIRGIPCTQGEDCVAVVEKIAKIIACPVTPSDLDVVHRVSTKDKGKKNLIARFCSRAKKNDFVSKARKARLCLSDIGMSNGTHPIFVNDHLTPQNKALFSRALALKKANNWKHLWTDNCQIKARKTNESRVCRISGESDLSVFN